MYLLSSKGTIRAGSVLLSAPAPHESGKRRGQIIVRRSPACQGNSSFQPDLRIEPPVADIPFVAHTRSVINVVDHAGTGQGNVGT